MKYFSILSAFYCLFGAVNAFSSSLKAEGPEQPSFIWIIQNELDLNRIVRTASWDICRIVLEGPEGSDRGTREVYVFSENPDKSKAEFELGKEFISSFHLKGKTQGEVFFPPDYFSFLWRLRADKRLRAEHEAGKRYGVRLIDMIAESEVQSPGLNFSEPLASDGKFLGLDLEKDYQASEAALESVFFWTLLESKLLILSAGGLFLKWRGFFSGDTVRFQLGAEEGVIDIRFTPYLSPLVLFTTEVFFYFVSKAAAFYSAIFIVDTLFISMVGNHHNFRSGFGLFFLNPSVTARSGVIVQNIQKAFVDYPDEHRMIVVTDYLHAIPLRQQLSQMKPKPINQPAAQLTPDEKMPHTVEEHSEL